MKVNNSWPGIGLRKLWAGFWVDKQIALSNRSAMAIGLVTVTPEP
jgi:hypothetical protein